MIKATYNNFLDSTWGFNHPPPSLQFLSFTNIILFLLTVFLSGLLELNPLLLQTS